MPPAKHAWGQEGHAEVSLERMSGGFSGRKSEGQAEGRSSRLQSPEQGRDSCGVELVGQGWAWHAHKEGRREAGDRCRAEFQGLGSLCFIPR